MHVTAIRSVGAGTSAAAVVGVHPGNRLATGANPFVKGVTGWVRSQLEAAGFDGGQGETAVLTLPDLPVSRVAFVGLGEELDLEGLRQAAACGRKALGRLDSIVTTLHRLPLDGAVGAVVDGFALADYRFDVYKSSSDDRAELRLELLSPEAGWEVAVERSRHVVGSVVLARDLVNEPPGAKAPEAIAERLAGAARDAGMDAEIWTAERLDEERLGGLAGVGRGSHRPPALLIVRHRPRRPRGRLAVVGKGIVFDSGGLSIKQAKAMETMKCDMAGAAAAVAGAVAVARLGLPVEVTAYAAFAENLPGGGAQRPGDVVTIRNGKTIEVLNTDAEGRLVLADALCLAAEAEPDLIVDLATLTGACKVALGPKIAGVFGTDEDVVRRVTDAATAAGERAWPLPLPPDYRPMIDSDVADMKNTSGIPYGGAITAASLLAEFSGDVPWAHMDIAGPAWMDSSEHYIPKGGTGYGVRTVVELAESMR